MAGAFIGIDVNARPVVDALERLADAGRDMRPAMRDIGEHLLNSTRHRIESGGPAPDGTPWAPLSSRYQAHKPKNADKVLILNSYLLGTLAYQADRDGVAVGTPRIYGAAQQFGRDDINLPARPFLGLSRDDERDVVDILTEHLRRAV